MNHAIIFFASKHAIWSAFYIRATVDPLNTHAYTGMTMRLRVIILCIHVEQGFFTRVVSSGIIEPVGCHIIYHIDHINYINSVHSSFFETVRNKTEHLLKQQQ